jgi:chemotaxis protein MotB
MKKTYIPVVFILICLALTSCVTKGKYGIAESRLHKLERDSANISHDLDGCNTKVKSLEDEKTALQAQKSSVESDLEKLSSNSNKTIAQSKMTIAEQAKRLKDLQDLIQRQKDVMNNLKKTIANALINFKADELSVYIKDGNVYVSLQEKLLFKSGSAVVDPKGKEALSTLASVLNSTPDINVNIEGHTDSIPIRKEKFEDNWALSVGRSTAIVRILTKDYGVDPKRVIASGRSEFHPIQTNSTDEGRSSNRRTEIILSPNLSELFKLLEE